MDEAFDREMHYFVFIRCYVRLTWIDRYNNSNVIVSNDANDDDNKDSNDSNYDMTDDNGNDEEKEGTKKEGEK